MNPITFPVFRPFPSLPYACAALDFSQASCSRYGLYIGAASIPIVKVLIALFFPLAYPLAWCLDRVLGEEMGTIHSKSEMKKVGRTEAAS